MISSDIEFQPGFTLLLLIISLYIYSYLCYNPPNLDIRGQPATGLMWQRPMEGKDMSDAITRKIAALQEAERQKKLSSQVSQAEDRAKLLPIKREHEKALQFIAKNLNIIARQMPGFLQVRWGRNAFGAGYFQYGPFLVYHQSSNDRRLDFVYALEIDTTPELKDLKGFRPSTYQVSPDAKVEVIGKARASALGLGHSLRRGWSATGSLGELALDPLAEVRDADFARTRLYESQIEALEKAKELLDEEKLAQVVFDLIPEYLR